MRVDVENLYILGVYPYIFFTGIGLVLSFLCFALLLKRGCHDINENNINFLISLGGLLVGAKLFGVITSLLVAWNQNEKITASAFLNSGIVFYGGLVGFLTTFWCVHKIQYKNVDYHVMDIVAVCIPLFHCFARLGCFFAGCCYGELIDTPISVLYKTAYLEAALRIPVQLIEAAANLIIFVICLAFLIKHILPQKILLLYLFLYAFVRFLLEFIRGDIVRGFVGIFSLSQIVSLIIFAFVFFQILKFKFKHRKKEAV